MSQKNLLVLAGDDIRDGQLAEWVLDADRILAADGAANTLARLHLPFDQVIGDLDSIDQGIAPPEKTLYLPDQDSTDCDKILAHAYQQDWTSVTLIGIEGSLPDHVLGILTSCVRSPLAIRLVYRSGLGWIVRGGESLEIPSEPGARVSLLPLTVCQGAFLDGVEWPLEDAELRSDGLVSVSNRAAGNRVRTRLQAGTGLLFLERPHNAGPSWDI